MSNSREMQNLNNNNNTVDLYSAYTKSSRRSKIAILHYITKSFIHKKYTKI